MSELIVRAASLTDLPRLTEIHNYYVVNTHISFDVRLFTPQQREKWFLEHSDGHRYRLLVAETQEGGVLGYATTGRFRNKAAYDTTAAPVVSGRYRCFE